MIRIPDHEGFRVLIDLLGYVSTILFVSLIEFGSQFFQMALKDKMRLSFSSQKTLCYLHETTAVNGFKNSITVISELFTSVALNSLTLSDPDTLIW